MTTWKPDFIRWPRPSRHRGKLDATAREHFVYWIYKADGTCLYVGRTCRPEQRRYEHSRNNPAMYAQAHRFRMAGPYRLPQAIQLEHEQIDRLQPAYGSGQRRFEASA